MKDLLGSNIFGHYECEFFFCIVVLSSSTGHDFFFFSFFHFPVMIYDDKFNSAKKKQNRNLRYQLKLVFFSLFCVQMKQAASFFFLSIEAR